jgi:hypothetical protein
LQTVENILSHTTEYIYKEIAVQVFIESRRIKMNTKTNKVQMSPINKLLKNRWALSTVVTTLIILVISVLLASVVTYFAINVVSTRVQEESLALTKQHVWYNSTGGSTATQGALMIINTGGRDVVIQKFAVRGQTVIWNNVFYATTTDAVSSDLSCNTTIVAGPYRIGNVNVTMTQASDSLTLRSGYSMILFINTPDSITINDVGLTVSITLNTAQAMYYVESNVQTIN